MALYKCFIIIIIIITVDAIFDDDQEV